MPYITKDRREAIAAGEAPKTSGELNYLLTTFVLEGGTADGVYVRCYTAATRYVIGNLNYARINDVLGAFTGCALEYRRRRAPHGASPLVDRMIGALRNAMDRFYREVAIPYEDTKIKQNGDVYPLVARDGEVVHGAL